MRIPKRPDAPGRCAAAIRQITAGMAAGLLLLILDALAFATPLDLDAQSTPGKTDQALTTVVSTALGAWLGFFGIIHAIVRY